MNRHKMANEYMRLNPKTPMTFEFAPDDNVIVSYVESSAVADYLEIPSFVTEVKMNALSFCNVSTIYINNAPDIEMSLEGLCSEIGSERIKIKIEHPECIVNAKGMFINSYSLKSVEFENDYDLCNVKCIDSLFLNCSKIEDVSIIKSFRNAKIESLDLLFKMCYTLKDISCLKYINTSNIKSMYETFCICRSIEDYSVLRDFDTRKLENLKYAFYGSSISDLTPLSNWDTRNLKNIESTFSKCKNLKSLHGIENWNIENLEYADFAFCNKIQNTENFKYEANLKVSEFKSLNFDRTNNNCVIDISAISNWKPKKLKSVSNLIHDYDLNEYELKELKSWQCSAAFVKEYINKDIVTRKCGKEIICSNREFNNVIVIVDIYNGINNEWGTYSYFIHCKINNAVIVLNGQIQDDDSIVDTDGYLKRLFKECYIKNFTIMMSNIDYDRNKVIRYDTVKIAQRCLIDNIYITEDAVNVGKLMLTTICIEESTVHNISVFERDGNTIVKDEPRIRKVANYVTFLGCDIVTRNFETILYVFSEQVNEEVGNKIVYVCTEEELYKFIENLIKAYKYSPNMGKLFYKFRCVISDRKNSMDNIIQNTNNIVKNINARLAVTGHAKIGNLNISFYTESYNDKMVRSLGV